MRMVMTHFVQHGIMRLGVKQSQTGSINGIYNDDIMREYNRDFHQYPERTLKRYRNVNSCLTFTQTIRILPQSIGKAGQFSILVPRPEKAAAPEAVSMRTIHEKDGLPFASDSRTPAATCG